MRSTLVRAFIPTLCLGLLATAGLFLLLAATIMHGNMWIDGGILNG